MWNSEQPPDAVLSSISSLTDVCGSLDILPAAHHKRTTTVLSLWWSGGCLQIGSDRQRDPATPGFVQWRQTLANRTLALHLPGGRQLFMTTGGALWTQQRSSGVCCERKKEILCWSVSHTVILSVYQVVLKMTRESGVCIVCVWPWCLHFGCRRSVYDDAAVRIKLLGLLTSSPSNCCQRQRLGHDVMAGLVSRHREMMLGCRARCYANSADHRRSHRVMTAILLLEQYAHVPTSAILSFTY